MEFTVYWTGIPYGAAAIQIIVYHSFARWNEEAVCITIILYEEVLINMPYSA